MSGCACRLCMPCPPPPPPVDWEAKYVALRDGVQYLADTADTGVHRRRLRALLARVEKEAGQ